jgi:hypothetical protein
MVERLMQRRRVGDDGLRVVNPYPVRGTRTSGNGCPLTLSLELGPANYVPAAAVIRKDQALSGITGRKGCAGGHASLT